MAFPFRKIIGGGSILELPVLSSGMSDVKKWEIPDKSIVKIVPETKKMYFDLTIPRKITKDVDWDGIDSIADFFTDEARMKSIGYGAEESPYDYFLNNSDQFNGMSPYEAKESLYSKVPEARPAYITTSYGVLSELIKMWKGEDRKSPVILDISAYGERAIAAHLLRVKRYDGIDPNTDLIQGHFEMKMTFGMDNVNFYNTSLEGFIATYKYDIITISPPPFTMEKYSSGEGQTHLTYTDEHSYFNGFIREMCMKIKNLLSDGGIFSFTALDRTIKGKPNIMYVEAMLLFMESLGDMEYKGAIGLKSNTPWFIFKKKPGCDSRGSYTLMKKYYPEKSISINWKTKYFAGRLIEVKVPSVSSLPVTSFAAEYVRYQVFSYMCKNLHSVISSSGMTLPKITTILGRYFLYENIFAEESLGDPVFPYGIKGFDVLLNILTNEYGVKEEEIKKIRNSKFRIYTKTFRDLVVGFDNFVESCSRFLNYYFNTKYYKIFLDELDITSEGLQISVKKSNSLSYIPIGVPPLMYSSSQNGENVAVLYKWEVGGGEPLYHMRYKYMGLINHQYTRPIKRTKIIQDITENEVVLDCFASPFNASSTISNYCSAFSDIEENSVGSFYNVKRFNGSLTLLVNPPAANGLDYYAVDKVIRLMEISVGNITSFIGFTLWTDINPNVEKALREKSFTGECRDALLNAIESKFFRVCYILDTEKFPTVDHLGKVQKSRSKAKSIGVVLSTLPNTEDNKKKYFNKVKALGKLVHINSP